jgi:hypothetical protein
MSAAFDFFGSPGVAAVVHCDVVDELEDDDRLPDAGAAEEAGLAPLRVRLEEVDDLDARLEHLDLGRLVLVLGRVAVDRPALLRVDRAELVDRLPDDVQDPAERLLADGHRDRAAGVERLHPADHSVGRLHRDAPHAVLAQVLRDLRDDVDRDARLLPVVLHRDGVVDLGKVALRELDVEDGADDLDDATDSLFCHFRSPRLQIPRRSAARDDK